MSDTEYEIGTFVSVRDDFGNWHLGKITTRYLVATWTATYDPVEHCIYEYDVRTVANTYHRVSSGRLRPYNIRRVVMI